MIRCSSGGASGREAAEVGRTLTEETRHDFLGRHSSKQTTARHHLVQETTCREDIAPAVHAIARDLFGRHVSQSAKDDPRGGGRTRDGKGPRFLDPAACETEVQDLHAAV